MARSLGITFFVGLAVSATAALAGCSTGDEVLGADEAAQTPVEIRNAFDLAENCARTFKRHESVRAIDLQQGVVRWACADVPGVNDADLGQEYCEYKAVQGGKIKTKASEIDQEKPVSCVFTSVFQDISGVAPGLESAMAAPENLGIAAADSNIVQMRRGDNTRNAATGLLRDCKESSIGSDLTSRLRVAACYQASVTNTANAAQLKALCGRVDGMNDTTWAKAQQLGASLKSASDADYDAQRDIAGCLAVVNAGTTWRNSDPMICSRAERTTGECGCSFTPVPNTLNGMPITGWVNDQIPSECRLAKVDGQPYPFVVICDLNRKEISDLPLNAAYARNLGNFCHDRFAVDLVMKLPMRALSGTSCHGTSDAFCSQFAATPTP